MVQNSFYTKLPGRGLIRVGGADAAAFLQNIITNDIRALNHQPALYACFLSAQGKFLHDFFVTKQDDSYLLECEGGDRAADLMKKIKLYKIGMKVELSCDPEIDIYAVIDASASAGYPDPRHPAMGWRSFIKPDALPERDFTAWDEHRLRLSIPDGSRDMIVGSDTLLDCNIDKFYGLSFDKGCYVGQEITARMHLRGLVKKHLHTVEINGPVPAPGTDIHINGKLCGQMRSSCGQVGLAMIRDDFLEEFRAGPIRLPAG